MPSTHSLCLPMLLLHQVERPVANLERLLRGADRNRGNKAGGMGGGGGGHKDFAKAEQVGHRANGSADEEGEDGQDGTSELGKPLLAEHRQLQQQGGRDA